MIVNFRKLIGPNFDDLIDNEEVLELDDHYIRFRDGDSIVEIGLDQYGLYYTREEDKE